MDGICDIEDNHRLDVIVNDSELRALSLKGRTLSIDQERQNKIFSNLDESASINSQPRAKHRVVITTIDQIQTQLFDASSSSSADRRSTLPVSSVVMDERETMLTSRRIFDTDILSRCVAQAMLPREVGDLQSSHASDAVGLNLVLLRPSLWKTAEEFAPYVAMFPDIDEHPRELPQRETITTDTTTPSVNNTHTIDLVRNPSKP
jgi:hypothetical protein